MQNDYVIQEGRAKANLAEEKRLRKQRERQTKRVLKAFCKADRKLERIATAWKQPPHWRREAWTRRMNNRWATAAGERGRLAMELKRIAGW